MSFSYTTAVQSKLQRMFDTCIIAEEKYPEVDKHLKQIIKGKERYHAASHQFNIPWFVTGIMHKTLCDCDFKVHLHNGDSLNGRTFNIPIGYPKRGRPPFTWEQSAEDTFQFYHLHKWSDWSVPGMLYNLEMISNHEYSGSETNPSKLWCFSNHFDAIQLDESHKCGGAILLRRMAEKNLMPFENTPDKRLTDIKKLGTEVLYLPNRSLPKVQELQRLMNLSGTYLREDGRAGRFTAKAYVTLTGEYLQGDPENGL